ncbi:unnamed protein product [Brugia timori]|uniref:G_PROTEIN_RECEP_F1_2 domain-containing protein n=1 Tax=Brugia timori TaxID=42155 RepID=A0A3P7USS8_9BILA|nr:unnamed protein product [Brugia timori]
MISFIPHMIVLLPEILLTKNSLYTCKTWINHLFSTINTSSFYAVLHFGFLWTLNRFLSIIFPKCNAFFESTKLYFLIIFVWLTAFAISFADYYYCSRSFEVSTLLWTANCTKQSSNSGKVFLSFRHIWALFLSIAMLAMYFAIFCNIRHRRVSVTNEPRRILAMNTRHGTSRLETAKYERSVSTDLWCIHNWNHINQFSTKTYERSVLIQAALTCGVFIIGIILINFLPKLLIKIFGQEIIIPVNIFINSFLILGRTVLPITLFATNKHARKYVYLFLKVDRVGTVRFRTILTNKFDYRIASKTTSLKSLREYSELYFLHKKRVKCKINFAYHHHLNASLNDTKLFLDVAI